MSKLLFVVHRYIPFPGGSEYYTAAMAEEALARGHDVSVLAGEHKGDQNRVKVTNDANILLQHWDLIIVHGAGVAVQDFVLSNALQIPSPILYMIILPEDKPVHVKALQDCKYIGWSTLEDKEFINKYSVNNKAVNVRHGIKYLENIGVPGFKQKYNIQGPMFLSCGGYWPNKAMKELAFLFKKANLPDAVLVTTGYDNRNNLMPDPSSNVVPLLIESKDDIMSAISEADCYLMHSYVEGFGLVLLESMLNKTPWIARRGSGARLLEQFGKTYSNNDELIYLLQNFNNLKWDLEGSKSYVIANHLISNTIDDIEKLIQ